MTGIAASGTCGSNLTWILDEDGVLDISGTGDMENYFSPSAPRCDSHESITSALYCNSAGSE